MSANGIKDCEKATGIWLSSFLIQGSQYWTPATFSRPLPLAIFLIATSPQLLSFILSRLMSSLLMRILPTLIMLSWLVYSGVCLQYAVQPSTFPLPTPLYPTLSFPILLYVLYFSSIIIYSQKVEMKESILPGRISLSINSLLHAQMWPPLTWSSQLCLPRPLCIEAKLLTVLGLWWFLSYLCLSI